MCAAIFVVNFVQTSNGERRRVCFGVLPSLDRARCDTHLFRQIDLADVEAFTQRSDVKAFGHIASVDSQRPTGPHDHRDECDLRSCR